MLCENCGKHEANVHITKNINGHVTELNLCSECARKTGNMPSLSMNMDSIFSDFFSSVMPARARRYMIRPQQYLNEYAGCEDCLEDAAAAKQEPDSKENRLAELRKKLKTAVDTEEYELAAKLRDEIRSMEKENPEA